MSKLTKNCAIFIITTLWLVLWRIVFSLVNLSDNVSGWLFSIIVQIVGMGVIPLLLSKFWVKEDIVKGYCLRVKLPPAIYALTVLLGFLLSYVTRGVSLLWQNMLILLGFTHINSAGTIYSDFGVFVMELMTTAMLPAMFEELTDRGLLLQVFKGVEDEKLKMVLIGALFGLAHQNVMQTGYAFIGGMLFAFVAIKTKSIIPGMIMHFMNNAMSVIGAYSEQKSGFFAKIQSGINDFIGKHFFIAIITWIAAGFAIVGVCKLIAKIMRKVEPVEIKEDNTYYYPNKMQYVDDLFGSGNKKELTKNPTPKWYEYAFLYGSVAVTVLTTMFTFMWGIWR